LLPTRGFGTSLLDPLPGFAELIGSSRREWWIISSFSARRIYAESCDPTRTITMTSERIDLAPVSRLAQRTGSNPILGGLHHHHHRAKFRFSVTTQDLTDPASRPLDQLGAKTSILGVGY
jgi:hypothetical protein